MYEGQGLCTNGPEHMKVHCVLEGVGHYGVFNGTRWRTEIQPRIREFIRTIEYGRGAIPDGRTARRLQHPELAVSPV